MIECLAAPAYLLTNDLSCIIAGFIIRGAFFGGLLLTLAPCYLTERFRTEVRATASGFCYHFGAVIGGFVAPVCSYFAVERHMGFAVPMLIATSVRCLSVILALLVSPETKGKVFVSELMKQ
jgi:MFS transporter, SHS family, lactate transporter